MEKFLIRIGRYMTVRNLSDEVAIEYLNKGGAVCSYGQGTSDIYFYYNGVFCCKAYGQVVKKDGPWNGIGKLEFIPKEYFDKFIMPSILEMIKKHGGILDEYDGKVIK
jgi:hypothetical protein